MDGKKIQAKKQALTLVELIVVITILAILGTIAFISLQGYSISARDSTRISDMSSMKTSLELFELDSGNYPKPTGTVDIVYSGAIVWKQGTFGENVKINTSKLDRLPTDPLTLKQYTYSVLSTGNQYQLAGIIEGDKLTYSFSPEKANAELSIAKAYVSGNYNEEMAKALSGTTCSVLAVPSIITNDTSVNDLQQIITNKNLVFDGYNNLPSSFIGTNFKTNAGFDFIPNNLVSYVDTENCVPLTDTDSYTARVTLLKGLQDAYSGTVLQNEGEIKNILALNIDKNSPSNEVINYAGNYVNNVLGGNISTGGGTPIVTYANCGSGSLNGYNYASIIHNQTVAVTKTGSLAYGVINYGADALCTNGTVTIQNEVSNIACNSTYIEQAGACIQDTCGSTVPTNAHSTAISQTLAQNWTYNIIAGVCTFVCDTNYTWNGSSCVANTKSTSCTGLPSNAIWNTASSITQTWSGTNWLPIESGSYNITASTTTCNYKCNTNYTWNGSSCVANTQTVTCGGTIPSNATASTATTYTQTWNGSAWSPTTNWGENQATCDFNCNSGYNWNGSSCIVAVTTYPGCNSQDITITGSFGTFVASACNLGTNISGTTSTSYGYYYQWGRNKGFTSAGASYSTVLNGSTINNPGVDTYPFVWWSGMPLSSSWEYLGTNNWGSTTNTNIARQGPCASGYHVPSSADWSYSLFNLGSAAALVTTLKLSKAGYIDNTTGLITFPGQMYYYNSSDVGGNNYATIFQSNGSTYNVSNSPRAVGSSVRCFKN